MWRTQYIAKKTVHIFLHVSCFHLMITLSHSYGTVGHNSQLEFTSLAHTPTDIYIYKLTHKIARK